MFNLSSLTPYAMLFKIAGAVLLVAGIFGGGMWLEHGLMAAKVQACIAARATDNAKANATAVAVVVKSVAVANAATDHGTKTIADNLAASNAHMEKVNALPDDHVLGRSPVLRAYLDGLH